MGLKKLILLHGAAALATVALYGLLGGENPAQIAAVVCMQLWWLVTLAAAEQWIQERRKKRDKDRCGKTCKNN